MNALPGGNLEDMEDYGINTYIIFKYFYNIQYAFKL